MSCLPISAFVEGVIRGTENCSFFFFPGFTVTPEMLSFYNKDMKWIIEPGDFTIMVGTSSDKTQEIKLTVIK